MTIGDIRERAAAIAAAPEHDRDRMETDLRRDFLTAMAADWNPELGIEMLRSTNIYFEPVDPWRPADLTSERTRLE